MHSPECDGGHHARGGLLDRNGGGARGGLYRRDAAADDGSVACDVGHSKRTG